MRERQKERNKMEAESNRQGVRENKKEKVLKN